MTPGRWRVTGLHGAHEFLDWETGETRTEVCTRWGVTSPEGYDHEFFTHAEALAYADLQARTVTLELPRVRNQVEIVTNGYRSFISRKASGRIWLESEGVSFCILPEEAESFAQTILALHYHHERNQK